MHISSLKFGKLFFNTYITQSNLTIVDIGSCDVNGTLKLIVPDNNNYIGVDICEGRNVDIIIDDPYILPFENNTIDVVLSTSCFEHCEFFWQLFLEIIRVLKPTGLFYLNAPSNGRFHRYSSDYWRFYPDSGTALKNWANKNGYNVMLLESFIGNQTKDSKEKWNDFVAIFLKNAIHSALYPKKIQDTYTEYTNGIVSEHNSINNYTPYPEDQVDFYMQNNTK